LTDDPATTVRQLVDAFNRVDADTMAACFAAPSFILDRLAPRVWPSAAADWVGAALVEAEQLGASDLKIELAPPQRNAVTGDAASFAAPATMSFKVRGQWRAMTQAGAVVTLALARIDGQWLISDWAWTIGRSREAPTTWRNRPNRRPGVYGHLRAGPRAATRARGASDDR
jgi:hypothetical protein